MTLSSSNFKVWSILGSQIQIHTKNFRYEVIMKSKWLMVKILGEDLKVDDVINDVTLKVKDLKICTWTFNKKLFAHTNFGLV